MNNCAICLEDIQDSKDKILSCGHIYHDECINSWFETKADTCPICRAVQDQTPDIFYKYKTSNNCLKVCLYLELIYRFFIHEDTPINVLGILAAIIGVLGTYLHNLLCITAYFTYNIYYTIFGICYYYSNNYTTLHDNYYIYFLYIIPLVISYINLVRMHKYYLIIKMHSTNPIYNSLA
jgi:hypothetical protein